MQRVARWRGLVGRLALVSALTFGAAPAAAQPAAARAQVLFDEGVRLLDQGDNERAMQKLAESYRLEPGVGVLLFLAESEERGGKLASAWAHFVAAESLARKSGAAQDLPRADIAAKRAGALAPRLATVAIDAPSPVVEGLRVFRDDAEVSPGEWQTAFPVDRGAHVVRATAPGKKPWSTRVDVARDGDHLRVTIGPLVADAPTNVVPSATGQRESPPSPPSRPDRTLPLVVGGIGLAGVAVGSIFGIVTLNKASQIKSLCPTYPTCDVSQRDAVSSRDSSAQTTATVSTVALIVGAVALGASVVLWLSTPSGASSNGQLR